MKKKFYFKIYNELLFNSTIVTNVHQFFIQLYLFFIGFEIKNFTKIIYMFKFNLQKLKFFILKNINDIDFDSITF